LLDLEKHLKKKAEWRKGVGEHSVPRERHGIYCEDQRVWNWRVQQQEHINLLEMRAVLLALQHFKTLLVSKAVVLATDNTTVVAYTPDTDFPSRKAPHR
jgi:non-ribosomal peptide synthetase component F